MALTHQAHQLLAQHFETAPTRVAVDATCGNGHDTVFLHALGFDRILAFDVQQQALNATRERLSKVPSGNVELILDGHEHLRNYTLSEIDCVMFNFGYLPGGDKNLTTRADTSKTALNVASNQLSDTGIMSLLCYPGHPAGAIETQSVAVWLDNLSSKWSHRKLESDHPGPTAPCLYLLTKRT